MSQITSGIRSILSHPLVYNTFQNIMCGRKRRQVFAEEVVHAAKGDKVLDIGCGTSEILHYLPEVEYWGFDISQEYIDAAKEQYGDRGRFHCQLFTESDLPHLPTFDIVLVLGVFHHMEDEVAKELLSLVHSALRPGGRLISYDPCLVDGQNLMARFLINRDRGQNVRDHEGYRSLAKNVFTHVNTDIKHQSWIPYTFCYMELIK